MNDYEKLKAVFDELKIPYELFYITKESKFPSTELRPTEDAAQDGLGFIFDNDGKFETVG